MEEKYTEIMQTESLREAERKRLRQRYFFAFSFWIVRESLWMIWTLAALTLLLMLTTCRAKADQQTLSTIGITITRKILFIV